MINNWERQLPVVLLSDIILDAINLKGADIYRAAEKAVQLQYDNIWLTEGIERESFSLAASISPLLANSKTRVGTNLTNVFTRSPLLIAMSTLTLDELSRQRFFLTIGSGGIGYIEKCHGMDFHSPLSRVREYFTLVRKLLTASPGERISFDGQYFKGISFTARGALENSNIDIYMSGLNPKMIQIAGELSDGLVLSHAPVEALGDVKHNLEIGAKRAGRDPSDVKIFVNSPVGLGGDESISALKKLIAFHISAPTYQYLLDLAGYGKETKQIRLAWESGNIKKAVELVSDDIITVTGLGYIPKDIRQKAIRLKEAGAIPIAYPATRAGKSSEDLLEIMELCSRSVS